MNPSPLAILLIDDHPASRRFLGRGLAALGNRVELAGTGADGIAALRHRTFDLVLTKLSRPGRKDGQIARVARRFGTAATLVNLQPQAESADGFDLTLATPGEILYFFDALRYLACPSQDVETTPQRGRTS